MISGQETQRVYSYNPRAHMELWQTAVFITNLCNNPHIKTNENYLNIAEFVAIHLAVGGSRTSLSTSASFYNWRTCTAHCLQGVQLP